MKNDKTPKPNAYDKQIEPLIKEISKKRGYAAEVHRQFCKLSKREIKRQALDAWLKPDRATRVEPSFSNACELFKAIASAHIVIYSKKG